MKITIIDIVLIVMVIVVMGGTKPLLALVWMLFITTTGTIIAMSLYFMWKVFCHVTDRLG